jgi:hypothetical protein
LRTRKIQSEIAILEERRTNMEDFLKGNATEKKETMELFNKSLAEITRSYNGLMKDIRVTYEDYQQQQYGNAVRVSMQTKTSSFYRGLAMAVIAGIGIGGALGLGLALLGLAGRKRAGN